MKLATLIEKESRVCLGLMSGTSMDGIDAALIEVRGMGINAKVQHIKSHFVPYSSTFRSYLYDMITSPSDIAKISAANVRIGELFAEAVLTLIESAGMNPEDVDLIGSHGQTVWHEPQGFAVDGLNIASTLQIGDISVIRQKTGVITVGDFRMTDIAQGGGGAPLIPYFDYVMLHSPDENRVALNLGGMANVTILRKDDQLADTMAFDTGPGSVLIDGISRILFDVDYDKDGEISLRGNVNEELLKSLMVHEFISRPAPKSTGREMFNEEYVRKIIQDSKVCNCSNEDTLATVTQFTVSAIEYSVEQIFDRKIDRIIVNGGGFHNKAIMLGLQGSFPDSAIEAFKECDISGDMKEAAAFAFYANEALCGHSINIPRVTGAAKGGICGKIAL